MKLLFSLALLGLLLIHSSEGRPQEQEGGGRGGGPRGGGGHPAGGPAGERPKRALCSLLVSSGVEGEEPTVLFSEPCAEAEETCDGGPVSSVSGLARGFFCQRPRPKSLHSYACRVEMEGKEPEDKECEVGDCSLGPLVLPLPDDMGSVSLTFCSQTFDSAALEGVASAACEFERDGDALLDLRQCGERSECNVGPLAVVLDEQPAEAFFCEAPRRENPRRPNGRGSCGRPGREPRDEKEDEEEEVGDKAGEAGDEQPAEPLQDGGNEGEVGPRRGGEGGPRRGGEGGPRRGGEGRRGDEGGRGARRPDQEG